VSTRRLVLTTGACLLIAALLALAVVVSALVIEG
jgi:hypothetical protein